MVRSDESNLGSDSIMKITIDQLPEDSKGVFLYCPQCRDEFSAARGDYFLLPSDTVLKCRNGHRVVNMRLMRRESKLVEVTAK